MKIEGADYLDTNLYKKIIIVEKEINEFYQVHVTGKKNNLQIWIPNDSNRFSNSIKQLSSLQQIESIVNYFLKNNIVAIQKEQVLPYYQNLFTVIKSADSFLALKLFCDKKIIYDCINKYQNDRDLFLIQKQDVHNYEVSTCEQESSYRNYTIVDNNVVCLKLLKESGNICGWDKTFFKEWLITKMKEQGEKFEFIKPPLYFPNNEQHVTNYQKLVCGKLIIELQDDVLCHIARQTLEEYNKNLQEKNKVLTLKKERI